MKKIAVVTSTRADYGLLRRLLNLLNQSEDFELQLLVTGTHLVELHGRTVQEIEHDGIPISRMIEIFPQGEKEPIMTDVMGTVMHLFTEAFQQLRPDLLLLLGDRFEIYAVASTAYTLRIPIGHIHGGEVTSGALDDGYRHCMTKLSQLHFTAAEEYSHRVIQLGEQPDTVFHVGGMGVDAIQKLAFWSKEKLEASLGVSFQDKIYLITFHPVTTGGDSTEVCRSILRALSGETDGYTKIFTFANADAGGEEINRLIADFCQRHDDSFCFPSLGQLRYLSLMKLASGVLGNSSSGLLEAPSLQVPTLNIGTRQEGRLMADSIITVNDDYESIRAGLLDLQEKMENLCRGSIQNPYGKPNAPENTISILQNYDWEKLKQPKKFFDLTSGIIEQTRVWK